MTITTEEDQNDTPNRKSYKKRMKWKIKEMTKEENIWILWGDHEDAINFKETICN